jgi:hypothetical protein
LKIEFSRVSRSRNGALTLVIDQKSGAPCCVAFARSRRRDPDDAICDLRSREGTTRSNIGFLFVDGSREPQARDQERVTAIQTWATGAGVDVVVWTDLPPNFEEVCGKAFSIEHAIAHVRSLEAPTKAGAAEYVWRAPNFVNTPLRAALQSQPWFRADG